MVVIRHITEHWMITGIVHRMEWNFKESVIGRNK